MAITGIGPVVLEGLVAEALGHWFEPNFVVRLRFFLSEFGMDDEKADELVEALGRLIRTRLQN